MWLSPHMICFCMAKWMELTLRRPDNGSPCWRTLMMSPIQSSLFLPFWVLKLPCSLDSVTDWTFTAILCSHALFWGVFCKRLNGVQVPAELHKYWPGRDLSPCKGADTMAASPDLSTETWSLHPQASTLNQDLVYFCSQNPHWTRI